MSSEVLNSLLKEYEQKKIKAELEAERRKQDLYEKTPRLAEIENELSSSAILTAKNILNNGSTSCLDLEEKVEKLKKEKLQILSSIGLPLDYLKPFYECKLCNDTGYITDKNYKTTMCSCLKQRLLNDSFNKSNIYNLEKENFNFFNPNIFSDEVDIAKYKLNISPRTNIINIKKKSEEFIDNFDNPEQKNLLFVGNTGLRKNFYD